MSKNFHNNKLWRSQRIILPEMREKAINTCQNCCFFTEIQGREEIRWGCVVIIPCFGKLQRRVPRRIHALEILRLVGKERLKKVLNCNNPEAQACGLFLNRYSV